MHESFSFELLKRVAEHTPCHAFVIIEIRVLIVGAGWLLHSNSLCHSASEKATIVVDDVNSDPRYLACSIETKSEIVVPILRGERVFGEIDIDSDRPAAFTDKDRELLEAVAEALAAKF